MEVRTNPPHLLTSWISPRNLPPLAHHPPSGCRGGSRWGFRLQRFADGSQVGRLVCCRECPGQAESLGSHPSHVAGERGEAALFGMRRHPRQLEEFIGHLGIEFGRGNRSSTIPGGCRELAAQGLEPGVHLLANRITLQPALPQGGARRQYLVDSTRGG